MKLMVTLSNRAEVIFDILKAYKESAEKGLLDIRDIALVEPNDLSGLEGWDCMKQEKSRTGPLNCILRYATSFCMHQS